jgi:ABC-type antimicrobial peptide transport system permease subunit
MVIESRCIGHAIAWSGIALAGLLVAGLALAHGVEERDALFLERNSGQALLAFAYLGAKHMITGYDHLLYLFGVIFFLYRPKDIAVYVTLFAVGHSITLLGGVLADIKVNVYLVDAVIGLSVAYKAFENLDGFRKFFNVSPNPKIAVFLFGLVHGFGLATKLQALTLSAEGLVANIISFNVGVEIGQLLALVFLLVLINALRASGSFERKASVFNFVLMFAGFSLAAYQLAGFFLVSA